MFSKKPPLPPVPRNSLSVKLGSWVAIDAKGWGVAIVPLVIIVALVLGQFVHGGALNVWKGIGDIAAAAQREPDVILEPPRPVTP